MERREFGKPRRLDIGGMRAHCPKCQGDQFVRARRTAQEKADRLFCFACGEEHHYTTLLREVAEQIVANAERTIREAEELRRRVRPAAQ